GIQRAQDITLHFDDVITEDRNQLKYTRATLNQRMNRLETFSDGADERLDSFDKKFDTLSDQFTRLSTSITDLDKQGIFTRGKIEKLLRELKKGAPGELVQKAEEEIEKLKAHDYLLFENDHRGTREEIKQKAIYYAQLLKGKKNVVDIGCGRGELLELFSANKTDAIGIDINDEMIEECKSRGLKAIAGSAIEYLENQPDGSLGGVTAIQVIEHLPTDSITTFFSLVFDKLEPGGIVAAETINPTALATFCGAFYLDMTHQKPIHPLALKFMLERIGYSEVHIAYRNPFPEDIRLIPFGYDETIEGMGADFIIEYNRNIEKLNNVLFTHSDYAVIGVK
ncbi:hypothetical protein MNBD_NITROSPINAE03-456, partial [hydrothermal vent metagenome]